MATIQSQLVNDSSTLANFKAWAQAISNAFSTLGWSQSADTGQVNWASIASVPGSGAYVYEVWQPNDGLTTFYLKVEYGNSTSQTNAPNVRISLASGSNGAGTLTGFIIPAMQIHVSAVIPVSTSTQYECNFSGAAGRIGVMMWRTATNNAPLFFGVERSLNSSGSYTSAHVTLWTAGQGPNSVQCVFQGSLVFGAGIAPVGVNNSNFGAGWVCRFCVQQLGAVSLAFNNSIPFDTCSPCVGVFDQPCTVVGVGLGLDFTEGVTFQTTLYGATRTYLPSKNGFFARVGPAYSFQGTGLTAALCMRFD